MWLVRFTLKKPYSVAAMALLIIAAGFISLYKLPVDVLPKVDIPSIKLIWTYKGLSAKEMASKVTTFSEVAIMNNVDDTKAVSSQTMNGTAIVRVDFQPEAHIATALAQLTSVSQTILRRMPKGMTPPLIVQYNQSSQPIIQLAISSDTLSPAELSDYARLQLRGMVQSIKGVRMTLPYGGATRNVTVDLRLVDLRTHNITTAQVSEALAKQNLTLPTGSLRVDSEDLQITLNAAPISIEELKNIPLNLGNESLVLLRDVADVRDGSAIQTNIARVNGKNGVLVSLIKLGNASTTTIINELKHKLPNIRDSAPTGIKIMPIFDQSVFVNDAKNHIQEEMLLIAGLVATIILLFIGSWQATMIVLASIPLSLLIAVCVLHLTGQSLNLMSLGGLALSIGILVDNALVEIENIERNIHLGFSPRHSALKSASEVALPELISTLSICAVFTPIFLLDGVAGFILRPMAIVVVSALLASYVLSRTVVPTLSVMMLKDSKSLDFWLYRKVQDFLDIGRNGVEKAAQKLQKRSYLISVFVILILVGTITAWQGIGQTFFPKTDAGLIKLYVRTIPGTRIENTAAEFADIQRHIRQIIPENELDSIVENIGTPESVNLAWVQSFNVGTYDGEILIQLKPSHRPTSLYIDEIRQMFAKQYPHYSLVELAADITNQTLAGTTPTGLEIQFSGKDTARNVVLAQRLVDEIKTIKGAVDVGLEQVLKLPGYQIVIDREKAARLGVNMESAAETLLTALGSANSTGSNYWSDPKSGFSYDIQVQAPLLELNSVQQLLNLMVEKSDHSGQIRIGDIAEVKPTLMPATVGRLNLKPTYSILVNSGNMSLGELYQRVNVLVKPIEKQLKPGNTVSINGQAKMMGETYTDLLIGFGLALFFVYIIMLFNFDSWIMPLIALSSVPFGISGGIIMLYLTDTWLSVPAIMGLIMVIGVTTANSVLVTSFAKQAWQSGISSGQAAIESATNRFRPVMMTSLTMIIGLIPMALALSHGSEQNAPLARVVIGGLLFGTMATLFVVPWLFSKIVAHLSKPFQIEDLTL